MKNSASQGFYGTLSSYTDGAVSAIRNTTGSVVAGVGSYVPTLSRGEIKRPEIVDPTSQETFEAFKSYNVATNEAANTRRMWANMIDKILGMVMFGAAAGAGSGLAGMAGAAGLGAFTGGAIIFCGAIALSIGAFFFLRQSADTEVTAKSMDVNDFHSQREAALIGKQVAKEVKKLLDEDRAPKTEPKPYLEARPEVSQISLQGVQIEYSGQQRLN